MKAEFSPAIRQFSESFLPFFVWGLLPGLVLPFLPEVVYPEINNLWIESVAQHTIFSFMCFSFFASGLYLLVLGSLKEGESLKSKFYDFLIKKPVYFGITFSGVAFGVLLGVGVAALIHTKFVVGAVLLVGALYMVGAFLCMWAPSILVKKSILTGIHSEWQARLLGLIMLIILPCIIYLAM